jgi:cobalamin biosynthesis Co2+ chelatase CbiK
MHSARIIYLKVQIPTCELLLHSREYYENRLLMVEQYPNSEDVISEFRDHIISKASAIKIMKLFQIAIDIPNLMYA